MDDTSLLAAGADEGGENQDQSAQMTGRYGLENRDNE